MNDGSNRFLFSLDKTIWPNYRTGTVQMLSPDLRRGANVTWTGLFVFGQDRLLFVETIRWHPTNGSVIYPVCGRRH